MADYLVRALAKEDGVRGLACLTTDIVNEVVARQNATPSAAALLAETLTGTALIGALLKIQQRVALKFEGNGPAEKVVTESDAYGKIRGFIGKPDLNVRADNPLHNTAVTLGTVGLLKVVKDLKLKELAESITSLAGSPIEAELTLYLTQSEQIPSIVTIGYHVNEAGTIDVAGGLLLQVIPPYEANVMLNLNERLEELPPLTELLRSGKTPEDILAIVFDTMPYQILETRELQFHCDCSRERTEQALMALGQEGLEELINTLGKTEVDCQFCQETYKFSREDLEDLLVELATIS